MCSGHTDLGLRGSELDGPSMDLWAGQGLGSNLWVNSSNQSLPLSLLSKHFPWSQAWAPQSPPPRPICYSSCRELSQEDNGRPTEQSEGQELRFTLELGTE